MSFDFVILAAGLGTRMKSSTPKIFQKIAGKPLIRFIIDACKAANASNIITIINAALKDSELLNGTNTVIQPTPLGSADALLHAIPHITSEYTIVTCGDMPLVEKKHFDLLMTDKSDVSFITMEIPEHLCHMAYGRVLLENNCFNRIVEYKEASPEEKKCKLANSGVYKFKTECLKKYISYVKKNNQSGEFYLTDLLEIMKDNNVVISTIITRDYWPFHGINTMEDLANAEKIVQDKLRKKFMLGGVHLVDPTSTYFSHDTEIDNDVVIEQNVIIGPGVKISRGSVIKSFSYLENCEINREVSIGPFARIRGDAKFMEKSSIGNFVEVKGSIFSSGSKAKHLSYIGDTTLGKNVNIGAGTITCNYDGVKKHKTVIGNDAFIGSNSTIVAPVTIGDSSIIGAGSVITKEVPQNSLAISRTKQENISDKAEKIWTAKRGAGKDH